MRVLASLLGGLCLLGCGDDGGARDAAAGGDAGPGVVVDGSTVRCTSAEGRICNGNTLYTCVADGEFLRAEPYDCTQDDQICVNPLGCVECRPNQFSCRGDDVVRCLEDGSDVELIEHCAIEEGLVCRDGECRNLCDVAVEDRSYVGCEFYAADLDNATVGQGFLGIAASAQQYAVVVSNPGQLETEVVVEVNDAPHGTEPREVVEVDRRLVVPGDLEVFELPRREVDGSSSKKICMSASDTSCPAGESCVCESGGSPCDCRLPTGSDTGLNDGTHTAVTSRAYRIRSQFPIIAYQFNPLDNVGVFSNDASLLIPTSAIGERYTIVGWPQTIADGTNIDNDFDSSRDDEDLRAFLTILGTRPETRVTVQAGPQVVRVLGAGAIPELHAGDSFELELGPFDVINLETAGLNADFTGTVVEANQPVSIFIGSEASDAPRFDTYSTRQCCADHLEEQLFPDSTLGSSFIIARMPPRTVALNQAYVDPGNRVAEVNEPEWVRVVAVGSGATRVFTTLPPPDDEFSLNQGENIILRADQDFEMYTENARPVAVLQVLPSQEAVGIPIDDPGGDPAIVAVPPSEQWRQDYVFLTPDKYAFDFVTISGDRQTRVLLDGVPLSEASCTTSPADGIERNADDPPPERVIHRCQLSFPQVEGVRPNVTVVEGEPHAEERPALPSDAPVQNDGVHTVVADAPVGVTVYGFDSFVSYGYVAGLNLKPIPR